MRGKQIDALSGYTSLMTCNAKVSSRGRPDRASVLKTTRFNAAQVVAHNSDRQVHDGVRRGGVKVQLKTQKPQDP